MKTLDEVIRAIEWCTELDQSGCGACPYSDTADNRCYEEDALHYLKLFQADCERVRGQLEDLKQEYRPNDPLTWDELRMMEGKPVWVEIDGYNGYWTIVHWNSNIVFEEYYDWNASPEDLMKAPLVSLDDTNFGKTWQAYRKERTNGQQDRRTL